MHDHHIKDVHNFTSTNICRFVDMLNIKDVRIQYSVKRLLITVTQCKNENVNNDIQEIIDTLKNWQSKSSQNKYFKTSS